MGDPVGGPVDLLNLPVEITRRAGDDRNPKSRPVPDRRFIKLSDGQVEGVAQLFLKRADHLAAVFQRLRMGNLNLESEAGDGHQVDCSLTWIMKLSYCH